MKMITPATKHRTLVPLLLFVILMLSVPLAGCGLFTSSAQAKAVEEAITEKGKHVDAFRYIKRSDVKGEIQAKAPQGTMPDEWDVTIDVTVPDIKKIQGGDIQIVEVPTVNLNASDQSSVFSAFRLAAKNALKAALVNPENLPLRSVPLDVHLSKTSDGWTATISDNSVDNLSGLFSAGMDATEEEILLANTDYAKLCIADKNSEQMETVFGDEAYANAVKIDSIDIDEEGYAVNLRYPDPEELYAAAAKVTYEAYQAKGKSIFGSLTDADASSAYLDQLATVLPTAKKEATASYRLTMTGEDIVPGADFGQLAESVAGIRKKYLQEMAGKVRMECVILEVEKPKTGLVSGTNSGQSLRISAGKNLGDLHLAFYKLPGSDLKADGKLTVAVYIRAGGSATVRLPVGNYKLIESTGSKWYGAKYTFGPTGHYESSSELIKIEGNYSYTLDLSKQKNGNLPTTNIPYPYG